MTEYGYRSSAISLLRTSMHWDKLAEESDADAEWDRKIGIYVGDGPQPQNFAARDYRLIAKSLRMEAMTGIPHCIHLVSVNECGYR